MNNSDMRYLLKRNSLARHLVWAALLIGLINLAIDLGLRSGVDRWSHFFGALAWTAAAGMILSAKCRT